jgi:methylenetetrahydrofolate reductase (NADPH)
VRIDALLRAGPTRSFEFFPPKDAAERATLDRTLERLAPLRPSFVSVTYRGGPVSRPRTFELVRRVQADQGLPAMAHLICAAHRESELREILKEYAAGGVENLMALGGDPPEDGGASPGDFRHAMELVELARECGEFAIGVAAQTRGHPHSVSLEDDRRHLARKLRVADFAVTQFFFDAAEWVSLVEDLARLGVAKPVIPGVIALTSLDALPRMAAMGGVVPPALVERLEHARARGGNEAVRVEGIAAATELCYELLTAGAPGLHFYTMNRANITREICHAIDGTPA